MKFWIGKDQRGDVHLFVKKPVWEVDELNGSHFIEKVNGSGFIPLGKRPKLKFDLKPGKAKKVEIEVSLDFESNR